MADHISVYLALKENENFARKNITAVPRHRRQSFVAVPMDEKVEEEEEEEEEEHDYYFTQHFELAKASFEPESLCGWEDNGEDREESMTHKELEAALDWEVRMKEYEDDLG
ncbi:hypothetical protein B0A50_05211 [Salinomyces thailandicus]|uniref:Uncharacterized protein n=1 Tax=Salinomyces thailandicus TaxID=706561 RepID=A0A4U0TX52_9PEZI|nr:hypothetical protein B0A50_05211 [Salinomyces thailandica]